MKRCVAALVMLMACGATGVADAQGRSAPPALADGDRRALARIVMSSASEVQLCNFAATKTPTLAVRSYCRNTIRSHARVAIVGMQLAQSLGAADVKFAPLAQTADTLSSLDRYAGHDFDRMFLLEQIEVAEDDEDTAKYALDTVGAAALRRYEQNVLARVQVDLEGAETALHAISGNTP